jgi:hypothetical protein
MMQVLAPDAAKRSRRVWLGKLTQAIGVFLLLALSIFFLAYTTSDDSVANRDFIEYWASGQLLVHRSDPYDANRIFVLERSAGWHGRAPIIMFNPPTALIFTLPLGLVRPKTGCLVWTLFVLAAWLGSIHMLWILNGRPNNGIHFIGFFFAPAMACFIMGQMSELVLLGVTLFLYFHRKNPLLAGAALVLCTLKPHLFLPFGVVLLVWAICTRAYRLLAGAATALTLAGAIPLLFDPRVYSHYANMAHGSGVQAAFIPTLSELLRIALNPNAFWLQFLPAVAGCLWAIGYFRRHRTEWDWHTHSPLLMLVSVLVAPYAWFFDGAVLLPSLLYAAYRARRSALAVLFGLLAVAEVELLLGVRPQSVWYLWPSAAWLTWYLWSMHRSQTALPLESTG